MVIGDEPMVAGFFCFKHVPVGLRKGSVSQGARPCSEFLFPAINKRLSLRARGLESKMCRFMNADKNILYNYVMYLLKRMMKRKKYGRSPVSMQTGSAVKNVKTVKFFQAGN